MQEALFYTSEDSGIIKCELCPHYCVLTEGNTGLCKVRTNIDGKLYSNNFERLTAVNIDPVEKKPLYHFYPGKKILSIGSNGCNLKCQCCQNWEIAHTSVKNYTNFKNIETDELLNIANDINENIGIAYTYNEPVVWFEYMIEIAQKAKKTGLKNVLVSNGYINKKPFDLLNQYIDAYNIDIKAFSEKAYMELAHSHLEPVLETIKNIVKTGKHLELTNLIIPTINDNIDEFNKMTDWIANELGTETILHLSRYFPAYKMKIDATPPDTLLKLFEIAKSKLKYVYLGNINTPSGQDTYCSKCGNLVISRKGYYTEIVALDEWGRCKMCNYKIVEY